MKALLKIGVFVFFSSFFGLTSFMTPSKGEDMMHAKRQDQKAITGVYDGHEDYGYNFIYKLTDGTERTITFQIVEAEVLKSHDLDSEALIGAHFKITYSITTEMLMDENDFEEEIETKTIIKLDSID
ncbi:hypothetical protein N7U66_15290 [Lacinutrix neustonica]|uniref:DUF4907 domain-containing protein n=1 Tax=Lacinutrix neustonica TaxID=2980107 RepID=A0A9E8MTU6_9FLAO|nr:hypothetical protein [Lacinutrix neustonica]WAC01402.1 hypothetical protein N7U66_15290 [Lacinutrix neustonica]